MTSPAETIPRRDVCPHVRVENLTKRFEGFTAVDQVSLDIHQGEFFSLLGPSGCGKTTLLRMLAGFEAPSAGRILLEREDMAGVPPYRRPVNMMFQSYALFPHLTVERNVAFGLKQDKTPKPEIAKRVAEALERVQLGPLAKRKPHQLSGGQRQRVALARCLVKRPKLLLLDEPLAALDRKLREQTRFELMNIQHEIGITFVIVTHDQEEAMTVSSRIAVMNHGRIVQVGTPAEVYEYPNSRYVAQFLGDVNLIEGRIAEAGPNHVLIGSAECTLRAAHGVEAPVGASVAVALRPEKLSISNEPPPDPGVNCLSGEVWDIGYLGNRSVYHVRLLGGRIVTVSQANRSRLIPDAVAHRDRVYLTWQADAVMVLP